MIACHDGFVWMRKPPRPIECVLDLLQGASFQEITCTNQEVSIRHFELDIVRVGDANIFDTLSILLGGMLSLQVAPHSPAEYIKG